MPFADSCALFKEPRDSFSLEFQTRPQASRGKLTDFPHTPAGFTARPLMDMDFVISCSLVRLGLPLVIQFLSVRS